MSYKYYKTEWLESRGDEYDNWGKSSWYFEVGDDGYAVRQIEVYENGQVLKYDESNFEDEYGSLADQPLDITEKGGIEITDAEFEEEWKR